ncbi:protein kinase domain protein [Ichthyophthirius multifiliis]|uniref:mitogen-activated protein kinase kinase n=1 Tax=Ichthyophthirius multifiliis TaxID=5932 RepID=G0QW23_ICHMU|nr:protein kinase domain protein [Ichthyophthirius multifiliis]EGR30587.1 protein kinase domain protein [Ichthyophthirius multifiliis]|eukprot:XP_004032174.1 protein kinase domain protein [Ichthyophthirius multifiliis]
MITIGIMRYSNDSGTVKKMLHAPTLKLYALKEQPVCNKEVRKNLKDWTIFWQNKLHSTGLHAKLYATFWNTPEGCVSFLTELLAGGSLQNLLENVGTLPENVIKIMLPQIIEALDKIHSQSSHCFGCLSPSQILFKQDGKIKVNIFLFLIFVFFIIFQIKNKTKKLYLQIQAFFRNFLQKLLIKYLYDCLINPNIFKNQQQLLQNNLPLKQQIQQADDIFQLGLLILICGVGSLNTLENLNLIIEGIYILLEDQNKENPTYKDVCCLIHSENIIYQIINQKQNINIQTQNNLTINNLINKDRFSANYISFLCNTLQFNYSKRSSLQKLLKHPLINQNTEINISNNINIQELLKISLDWTKQAQLPLEYQGAGIQQLERVCDAMILVLPNCEKWFKTSNYMEYTRHIKHLNKDSSQIKVLANDFGINANIVYEKISQVLTQLNFISQKNIQKQK